MRLEDRFVKRGPVEMTIQDRIVAYLLEHPEGVDDDALTAALNLRQRQQANQRCRRLEQYGFVSRRTVNGKIRNFLNANPPKTITPRPTPNLANNERPWFWEGHVQDKLASHLRKLGYAIEFLADTATKQQGKDIVAVSPSGETLWVSVKGYPRGTERTNAGTQSRHWFAHALFDLILWRGQDASVSLALALPDQNTYRRLANRIDWFLSAARACIFWVDEHGTVVQQECRPQSLAQSAP